MTHTDIAECLIVGTKTGRASARGFFVVLQRRPQHQLESFEVAQVLRKAIHSGRVNRLEDGPIGGTELAVGEEVIGSVIGVPLANEGPWQAARIADFSIAQTAYQLVTNSRLWLPGLQESRAEAVPITGLGELAHRGTYHLDIRGTERAGGAVRGPFDVKPLGGRSASGVTYPMLRAHDAKRERAMVVPPDCYGAIRRGGSPAEDRIIRGRAAEVWAHASHSHVNLDFRFNSQSLAAAYTAELSIGGRAWPSVLFSNDDQAKAFVAWSNCTLGLLLY